MPRWDFWKPRDEKDLPGADVPDSANRPRTASYTTPPPLQTPTPNVLSPERRARRIDDLIRRRDGLRFDIEQGELAQDLDNPWQERIALLRDAMATVAADRAQLAGLVAEPTLSVPGLPVSSVEVSTGEPSRVSFRIGGEQFEFVEATDWDNRGGMVVRGDLRRTAGDHALIPIGQDVTPPPDWLPTLESALLTVALALRDAALDDTPPPAVTALRDILREDVEVGGWTNLHGTNAIRVQRAYQRQELRAEEERLRQELTHEDEQRRTLVDRLPVARKRLATVMDDLETLGVDPDQS